MYEAYYHFSAKPFQLSPDPRFFFSSKGHRRAMAYLVYGVHQGEGFIVITGEIGAGKTMLARTLARKLASRNLVLAQVVSTQLGGRRHACAWWRRPSACRTRTARRCCSALEKFLLDVPQAGQTCAAAWWTRRKTCRSSRWRNCACCRTSSVGDKPLLQSFLLGQPEFRRTLQSPAMEQLRQRVIASCHLGPMDERGNRSLHRASAADRGLAQRSVVQRGRLCRHPPVYRRHSAQDQHPVRPPAADGPPGREARVYRQGSGRSDRRSARRSLRLRQSQASEAGRAYAIRGSRAPHSLRGRRAPEFHEDRAGHPGHEGRIAPLPLRLVHTGQHYDPEMNSQFFQALGIPDPDINLEVGSASHAVQTAEIMRRFEPVLDRERPAAVLVVGDVNSTLACALVAVKKGVAVIHVEAGLRSFDRTMPEEINRVLTDQISDLLFITEKSARENLLREGIPESRIHFVGNVMIDTLRYNLKQAVPAAETLSQHGAPADWARSGFAVLTLHRPSNVDDPGTLRSLLGAIGEVGRRASGRLPHASENPRQDRAARAGLHAGSAIDSPAAAARLSRDAGADAGGAAGADRLGRDPGGDHRAGYSLRHAARQHRTADYRRSRAPTPWSDRIRRVSWPWWTRFCARAERREGSRSCGTAGRPQRIAAVLREWLDRTAERLVA